MKRTGAQIITALLERQGIETVAGIPGGCNLPLYDALRDSPIHHVLARHEQGAGFIAQGMARATGKAAVCLATSGPGATNLLTAIADAKLDSVPIIAITGQVPASMIGTDAFQEVDTYGLTLPITKHNFIVRNIEELLEVVPEAFHIALSGRPGPVAIDVPKDMQTQTLDITEWPEPGKADAFPPCDPEAIRQLADRIHRAKKPVLYIGGGIIASGASEDLAAFARKNGIPVACTLSGLGAFPANDPLYLGMLGMHGAQYTNLLLDEADLILAFGVRFDDRATGRVVEFCKHADIIHVDIDPSEISKIKPANLAIVGDVGNVLRSVMPMLHDNERSEWRGRIMELKDRFPLRFPVPQDPLHPMNFLQQLSMRTEPGTIITTDVGQHQMWVAQAYPFQRPRTLLTSGGLGTMGFGLPAAIGAALARPGIRAVCVSGDGSILMNLQELATLAELNLDVTVFIMNNHHLGLVRQQQELFYGQRYFATQFGADPDFARIAEGFGLRAWDLGEETDPMETVARTLNQPGPCVINVPVHQTENVLPMVPPGKANREMIIGELTYA
ncbi:MAG TPA: biosynthetic-type acetolactate synthase large subunit [Candidatus Hydrogenedentes bacterium]|nr:biosynthetic-type acetolactate synthase large subunit [Candidatus Hydrogenedentota bacterium]